MDHSSDKAALAALAARSAPADMSASAARIPLVIIESPFWAESQDELEKNKQYALACLQESLDRGEAPFASHAFYTQPGLLDDRIAEERDLGIRCGFAWAARAWKRVVYTDRGISPGMRAGIEHARSIGQKVEYRRLDDKNVMSDSDMYGGK